MSLAHRLTDPAWLLRADRERPSRVHVLHREMFVPAAIEEAFAFFAEAANLERLTPPWLRFTILTPLPIVVRRGIDIDYRIRLYGCPVPWRSRITVWEPGVRFVDLQTVGPYRWWHHEHRFEPVMGGTLMTDRVEYVPRASWLTAARVARDLERIFTYRQHTLREVFPESQGMR